MFVTLNPAIGQINRLLLLSDQYTLPEPGSIAFVRHIMHILVVAKGPSAQLLTTSGQRGRKLRSHT